MQKRSFIKKNGERFYYTYFHSEHAQCCVLISPATGVKQHVYYRFAQYLVKHGFAVLTWDWSGICENLTGSIKKQHISMQDWAQQDLNGIIHHMSEQFPEMELYAIGHSFGGQAFGLADESRQLKAIVTIAAQSGYWKHWPRPSRYKFAVLWYLLIPVMSKVYGYFPAKKLGLGEDLPKDVALQWAAWCRDPEYLQDYQGHQQLTQPMMAYYISDDPFAPKAAVLALHQHYCACPIQYHELNPSQLGVSNIGHFGFFKLAAAEQHWSEVVAFFNQQTAA